MRFSILLIGFLIACISAQKVITLTEDDFDEKVMQSDSGRWLVKFYAPWCPHCRDLAPVWDQLSESVPSSIHVAEIDGSKYTNLMHRFSLSYFPSVMLFINGSSILYDDALELRMMKGFAMYSTLDPLNNIVPYYPLNLLSVLQKFVSIVNTYLHNHPLVFCSGLFSTGVFMGFMIMQIYYMLQEDDEIDEMDETPVEKEKENYLVCLNNRYNHLLVFCGL